MNESLNIEQHIQTIPKLSPRQVQFVRLLEMTAPEIEDEVRRQLDDNPALETVADQPADVEVIDTVDDNFEPDPDDDPADRYFSHPAATSDAPDSFQIADDDRNLYDVLNDQLGVLDLPQQQLQLAQYIIGNLDDNGYMTRTLTQMADDIAFATGIDVTYQMMREAFDIVRTLDPPGIGAVDLRDCLLLQLRRLSPSTPGRDTAIDIVSDNFDLFSKMHYDRLRSRVDVSDTEFRTAQKLILALNPKPGSAVAATQSGRRTAQITPDVAVEVGDDGRFSVSIVSSIPTLQVERSFTLDGADTAPRRDSASAAQRQAHRQSQAFIKSKRDDAEAFIGALQQRSSTLLAVTEAIVRLQHDFFVTNDKSTLKPMILKDVAAVTGLDLSVISRATAGKYVATPAGTYPFKQFFSEAHKTGADVSTHKIQHELQTLIDNEDKRHPLSDESICQQLNDMGYNLARRTVAKYREGLNIPVARLRKSI